MAFENLIGNETVKKLLSNTIEQNKVTHSYLFLGPSGIGKTLFAKEFAKMILGSSEENQPDLIFVEPEDGTIKIEKIRQMQEKILEKPIISSKKVYIIKDADMMTKEAGNCLLKTLEEPPAYAVILLLTSNESALLLTIKSRCLKIPFEKIPDETLKSYLLQNGFSNVTEEMLRLYDGSIGKAIELKEKQEEYDSMIEVVKQIEGTSLLDYMKLAETFGKNKEDIQELLAYLIVLFYQKTKEDLRYRKVIELVEQAKIRLSRNANFDMTVDQMLLKMWEEMNEKHRRS